MVAHLWYGLFSKLTFEKTDVVFIVEQSGQRNRRHTRMKAAYRVGMAASFMEFPESYSLVFSSFSCWRYFMVAHLWYGLFSKLTFDDAVVVFIVGRSGRSSRRHTHTKAAHTVGMVASFMEFPESYSLAFCSFICWRYLMVAHLLFGLFSK